MSSQQAYMCDAPKCAVLTTKPKGVRYPEDWVRVTVHVGNTSKSGAFHSEACATAWVTQELGTTPAATDINTTVGLGHHTATAAEKS